MTRRIVGRNFGWVSWDVQSVDLATLAATYNLVGRNLLVAMAFKTRYDMHVGEALFIVGFLILGYDFTNWRWPVWLGSITE
jgi:hypothetical protein